MQEVMSCGGGRAAAWSGHTACGALPSISLPPELCVYSDSDEGSCRATSRYVIASSPAAETRNKPAYRSVKRSRTVRLGNLTTPVMPVMP